MDRRSFFRGILAGASVASFWPEAATITQTNPLSSATLAKYRVLRILDRVAPGEALRQLSAQAGPVVDQLHALGFAVGDDFLYREDVGFVDLVYDTGFADKSTKPLS